MNHKLIRIAVAAGVGFLCLQFFRRLLSSHAPDTPTTSDPPSPDKLDHSTLQNLPDWIHRSVTYTGPTVVNFKVPACRALGECVSHFDWDGNDYHDFAGNIEAETEQRRLYDHAELVFGSGVNCGEDGARYASLSTDGADGTMQTSRAYIQAVGGSMGLGNDHVTVRFLPLFAEYEVRNARPAKYWAMPLINFAAKLRSPIVYHPLDHHPLRINPVEPVPDGLTGRDLLLAERQASQQNRLIVFEHQGTHCFVEPLPDYDGLRNDLTNGTIKSAVTSMLVGEVNGHSLALEAVKQWFPFDILSLLGLATGTEVGAPWIEFRDEHGDLVKRLHLRYHASDFFDGLQIARDEEQKTISQLLSTAINSPNFGKTHVHVAIRQFILSGHTDLVIEDQLSHVFRGLDCFCEAYGLTKETDPSEILEAEYYEELTTAITAAVEAIRLSAKAAGKAGHPDNKDALDRIAGQVGSARMLRQGFGRSVLELLTKYGLHDAEVMRKFYMEHPRPDNRRWQDVVPSYRGITMHKSYFEFESGKNDIRDVNHILRHLRDVLLRIILSELGYSGPYQPIVFAVPNPSAVNWVRPDTPAAHLGFSHPPETADTTLVANEVASDTLSDGV